MNLEELFGDRVGASMDEIITPYKTAIYLLICAMDKRNSSNPMQTPQFANCALLLHRLIDCDEMATLGEMLDLFWTELGHTPKIRPKIHKEFLDGIERSRSDMEVSIRREDLLRKNDRNPFVIAKSVVGVFVRKLALARSQESLTELLHSHQEWLKWIDTAGDLDRFSTTTLANPSIKRQLFRLDPAQSSEQRDGTPRSMGSLNSSGNLYKLPESVGKPVKKKFSPTKIKESPILSTPPKRPKSKINRPITATAISAMTIDPIISRGLSSRRAKKFLDKQMHLLAVAPSEAMEDEELEAVCTEIGRLYPHLQIVHMVKMLNSIRDQDFNKAEDSLRRYFDWTAIRANELLAMMEPKKDISDNDDEGPNPWNKIIDRRSQRYAPILLSRLCRMFGFRDMALHYLTDAVQQAQENFDFVCLRLAVTESRAIEFMPKKTGQEDEKKISEKGLTRIFWMEILQKMGVEGRKRAKNLAAEDENLADKMVDLMTLEEEEEDDDWLENFNGTTDGGERVRRREETMAETMREPRLEKRKETDGGLVRQLRKIDVLQRMITATSNGAPNLNVESAIAFLRRSIFDLPSSSSSSSASASTVSQQKNNVDYRRERQRRLIEESSMALASSLRLSRGMVEEAEEGGKVLLHLNAGDLWASRFDTESQVIARVNIAYCLSSRGQFDQAEEIIKETKRRFRPEDNWMCARHWKFCEAIVNFDSAFFMGKLKMAGAALVTLRNFNEEEADLRSAVYFAVRGELGKALDIAGHRMIEARKNETNIRSVCRMKASVLFASSYNRMTKICLGSGENQFTLAQLVLATLYARIDRTSVAREILIECRDTAESEQLKNLANSAARRLALVMVQSNEVEEAVNLLTEDLLTSVENLNGQLELGLTLLTLAEALKSLRDKKAAAAVSNDQLFKSPDNDIELPSADDSTEEFDEKADEEETKFLDAFRKDAEERLVRIRKSKSQFVFSTGLTLLDEIGRHWLRVQQRAVSALRQASVPVLAGKAAEEGSRNAEQLGDRKLRNAMAAEAVAMRKVTEVEYDWRVF